jgi:prolyl oligopeptidase
MQQMTYPTTRRDDQVDDYHGTIVPDPYRWLEDDNSPETEAWVRAQNEVTFSYLKSLPQREPLRRRLEQLWNYPRYSPPFKRGGRYFYFKNDGLQNQEVLYVQESLDAEPRILLDPNTFSTDGTVALSGLGISHDGNLLAYRTSKSGSDWQELRVRDVASGADLDDRLDWLKFAMTPWTRDGRGFFYSRYPQPDPSAAYSQLNRNHTIHYHRLGEPQSSDPVFFRMPERPEALLNAYVTEDGRWAIIYISESGPENLIHYVDLGDPMEPSLDAPVVKLIDRFEASYNLIGNDGTTFYFQTTLDAPRGRVIAIDIEHPEREKWRTIIPEGEEVIEDVSLVGDRFIVTSMHNAVNRVRLFDPDGTPSGEIPLPTLGSVYGAGGKREDTEIFYMFTSFLYPSTIFRYDMRSGENDIFRAPEIAFDPTRFQTTQVRYASKDGTQVPMFITHRRDLALDGTNPTLLYGYGGFNVSLTPFFSVTNLLWLENGGVFALPSLRGGGELGEEWHRAGTLERKQNVFDDFIAAAEYLIARGYTSPAKLAIQGGSNGGLLVGAMICQRPDLFAVALPQVGVMDMLRYHRFTIGMAWKSDYGTSDDPEQFRALYAYSPLHNLRPGTLYPATLVTTADHDDRVVPAHSFKFAARLQECADPGRPALIRIETKAGHGAGKPVSMLIEEAADLLAFTMHNLGMDLLDRDDDPLPATTVQST